MLRSLAAVVRDIFWQLLGLARGLEHLSRHGILHQDIKGENCMVAPDGTLKIVDYGLANKSRAELVRDPKSVVRGVLWLNRACSFITEFVAQLATGREGVDAAKNAYVSELKRYHGFLTGAVVSKLMGFAPRRSVIHEKMCPGLTEEEAAAQVRAFLAEMQPLTREIAARSRA